MLSIEKFHSLLIAFVLTDYIIIGRLIESGSEDFGNNIASMLNYLSVLVSCVVIVKQKFKWKLNFIILFLSLLLLCYWQKTVATIYTIEKVNSFIVGTISGLIIGYSLFDIVQFSKYLSYFSIFYAGILLQEPFLHMLFPSAETMNLGYTMSPIAIWSIMGYYLGYLKKWTLLISISLAVETFLFTSRGCGISIISFILLVYLYRHKDRLTPYQILRLAIILAICSFLFIMLLNNYIQNALIEDNGSFIAKFSNGDIADSNGRQELWDLGFELLQEYWSRGLGVAGDRIFFIKENEYFHNVIIEILVHFGIPLGSAMLYSYWKMVITFLRKHLNVTQFFIIISAFVCVTWVKLMVSDTYIRNMNNIMFITGSIYGILALEHNIIKKKTKANKS